MDIQHISVSRKQTWDTCQQQYKYKYHLKLTPEREQPEYFAYGKTSSDTVKIRILGVLSDLEIPQNTKLFSKNDSIKIKTLGIDLKDQKSNFADLETFLTLPPC